MQLKFNLLSPYLLLTSSDLSCSFFWWKGVTVTWHNSLPGVTNVLVDRIVSLPAHHCSGHRPSPKRWRSTTPWKTSTWVATTSGKEQRPGARQRGASGAKVVETWESQEVLGGCWACGSFKKSLKWNGTRLGNFSYLSTWQIQLDVLNIGLNFHLSCYYISVCKLQMRGSACQESHRNFQSSIAGRLNVF